MHTARCHSSKARFWFRTARQLHTSPPKSNPWRRPGRIGAMALGLGVPIYLASTPDALKHPQTPLIELVRSYVVYGMLCYPSLVEASPKILGVLTGIPGVRQITEAVVRATFFNQFVGGDSAEDTLRIIEKLRDENIGTLLAYSVEVDEAEATGHEEHKDTTAYRVMVDQMIHSIDVAADFEDKHALSGHRRTWVAVKISALLPDANALWNLSKYLSETRRPLSLPVPFPGCPQPSDLDIVYSRNNALSERDKHDLKELHESLVRICTQAQKRGIKIIVDAEYTWYQPAIDAFVLSLMRQFNQVPKGKGQEPIQPLIYATFQAYLRRTPAYLTQSLIDAKAGNYSLGVKLVRGAYHVNEQIAHPGSSHPGDGKSLSISPEPLPPVWTTKPETDACYNQCALVLMNAIRDDIASSRTTPTVGVLFGTHNHDSCNLILGSITELGIGSKTPEGQVIISDKLAARLTFGQLYGMSDALTRSLTTRVKATTPFVIKYVPFGGLSEVMPYLARRAIENQSMLGGGRAEEEKKEAGAEIWKRMFG